MKKYSTSETCRKIFYNTNKYRTLYGEGKEFISGWPSVIGRSG
jgi:hypothetical protein